MNETILNANQIRKILPQRYPFALIDRVVEFEKGKKLVAVKNVTANEWPFSAFGAAQGHNVTKSQSHINSLDRASRFTQDASQAVFPRTLLIEAAAQAALLLYHLSMVKEGETPRYILGRVKAEFFEDVRVGEDAQISVEGGRLLRQGGYSDIKIFSKDLKIAEIFLVFSVSYENK